MIARSICWVGLGALSVACAAGAFEPKPTSKLVLDAVSAESPRVAGALQDTVTGRPALGALVVLQCGCLDGTREAEVDPRGRFHFSDLPQGAYTVQVLYGQADYSWTFELEPDLGARLVANISKKLPPRVIT